jgi:hypothetical protein
MTETWGPATVSVAIYIVWNVTLYSSVIWNIFLHSFSSLLMPPFILHCRSQWPRCLRRRSAAARPLRSWVSNPTGAWMFVVNVVCCQVEVSATSWSLVQRSPTYCDALMRRCVWSRKPQEWGGLDPLWVAAPQQKQKTPLFCLTHFFSFLLPYFFLTSLLSCWVSFREKLFVSFLYFWFY